MTSEEESSGRHGRWQREWCGHAFVPVLCALEERALDGESGNSSSRTCAALAGIRKREWDLVLSRVEAGIFISQQS